MPANKLASIINLSCSSLRQYKKQQKNLDILQTEHLLKLIGLYKNGEEIFGNLEEFNYWLRNELWNSKETPISSLNSSKCVDSLMKELNMLAQGYPV